MVATAEPQAEEETATMKAEEESVRLRLSLLDYLPEGGIHSSRPCLLPENLYPAALGKRSKRLAVVRRLQVEPDSKE